ncbi:MAG: AMP-binding protein, partial [Candidatus Diapherotrites archaeon]
MEKRISKMNALLHQFGHSQVKTVQEWNSIPPSSKKSLPKNPPKHFFEMRVTSGSTGDPLFIYYSKEAVEFFLRRTVKSIQLSEVTPKDTALNLFTYGSYIPGSMYERACNRMNLPVIPLGGPNTYSKEKMLFLIQKLRPNVWMSLPSYALNLLSELKPTNYPKKVLVAGEKLYPSYIRIFKEKGVEVINHFGLTECPAIGVSEKNPSKIKVIEEGIRVESIAEESGENLLVTDYQNFSTPIIRYRTGDIIKPRKVSKDGSISEFEMLARSDDLVKLRGSFVSKNKIIESLLDYSSHFQVVVSTKNNKDVV